MIWRVRRVLTGHDAQGRSTFIADGPAPNVKEMAAMPGLALTDLWETERRAGEQRRRRRCRRRPVHLEPPKNGTILRIVEFPPDSAWRDGTDGKAGFKSIGAGHAQDKASADPMMHKTSTVDYIIVLKGEIYAIMETGEKLLRAGDILVQRGTNHSWSVRGNEPCIVAAVLVSAKPVRRRRSLERNRQEEKEMNAVGVIGLGIMGSAMSANLVKAGFEVRGYDIVAGAPRRAEACGRQARRLHRASSKRASRHHLAAQRGGACTRSPSELETQVHRRRDQHAADRRQGQGARHAASARASRCSTARSRAPARRRRPRTSWCSRSGDRKAFDQAKAVSSTASRARTTTSASSATAAR